MKSQIGWFCRYRTSNCLILNSHTILIHVPFLILQLSCARLQPWDPLTLTSYTTGERVLLAWVRWLIFYRKIQSTTLIQLLSQLFIFPCSTSSTIQGRPLQIIMLFWSVLCTVSLVSPMHLPTYLNPVQPSWWVQVHNGILHFLFNVIFPSLIPLIVSCFCSCSGLCSSQLF